MMPKKRNAPLSDCLLKETQFPSPKRTKDNNDSGTGAARERYVSNCKRTLPTREDLETTTITKISLNKEKVYLDSVHKSADYFTKEGFIVLPDVGKKGLVERNPISRKYMLLHSITEVSSASALNVMPVLKCSCSEGRQIESLVQNIPQPVSDEAFLRLKHRLSEKQCIHMKAAIHLFENIELSSSTNLDNVTLLKEVPLLAIVCTEAQPVGLIQRDVQRKLVCRVCVYNAHSCFHLADLKTYFEEYNIPWSDIQAGNLESKGRVNDFSCASHKPIAYPLSYETKANYSRMMATNERYPSTLFPSPEGTCKNGFPWNKADPSNENWMIGSCKIYTLLDTMCDSKVFYRLCCGPCLCQKNFDGQELLLFNINNRNMVDYSVLFNYMFLMVESRNPLAVYHRAYRRTITSLLIEENIMSYDILRRAWLGMNQLIDIDWTSAFTCRQCKLEPTVVVCDGTSLGYKQSLEFSPPASANAEITEELQGIPHDQWVMVKELRLRKLLARFTGTKRGKGPQSIGITHSELEDLITSLKRLRHVALSAAIKHCAEKQDVVYVAQKPFRSFLYDLSCNTPVHALLQGTSREAFVILQQVGRGLEVWNSGNTEKLQLIETEAPILCTFLSSTSENGQWTSVAINLMLEVIKVYNHSFEGVRQYSLRDYPIASEDENCFFPALPIKHGTGFYRKDTQNAAHCREDWCNKFASRHPTLSPGLFTVFCEHGINYGFIALQAYESPKVPHEIFLRNFISAPKIIVYDNACKAHQYALNREPAYFKDSIFVCDRLHLKNHTACSSGYDLDKVTKVDPRKINSQVNEQANACLKRLKGQTSYMTKANFMSTVKLFLALRNMAKNEQA